MEDFNQSAPTPSETTTPSTGGAPKRGRGGLWLILVIIIVGVLYYVANRPTETTTVEEAAQPTLNEPLKIGGLVPLTGDAAAYGLPIQKAAMIAVEEINEAGGVLGQPIEVKWVDGQCEAAASTTATQQLINIDGVKVIFGGICSSETLAAAPLTEAAKVIVISPSSTSPDVTTAGDFVFRTAPSDALAGRIAAEYAYQKLGFTKAAALSENKDYAQGLSKVFTERFAELGGQIVANEAFNTGDVDFSAQLLKVKAAAPEIIYLAPQTPASGLLLAKQLREKGISAQLLTGEVLIGRDVISENASLLEGLVGVEGYFDESGEKASAFLAKYEETAGEKAPFPFYMANIHAQFYLLKEAVEAEGLETEKLRDYLYNIKDWSGTGGVLNFDANGDPLFSYAVQKVEGGSLKQLDVITPSQ